MRRGDRKRHLVIALAMAFVLTGIVVIGLSENGDGQTIIPVVYAQFDDSSRTADVEPGNPSNGIVINTGTIHCDCGSQPRVDVDLTIIAGGWGAAIAPSSMTFYWGGEDEQPFQVTVRAPEGTSHKVSQNVAVGGTWTGVLGLVGEVSQSTFIIFIEQYFALILESDDPEDIGPGESGNISFKIWNMGNDEDDFIIEFDNAKELINYGWQITTVPKQTVEEKGVRHVRVYIKAPSVEDTYHFELTVTSEGSKSWNPDDVRSASLDIFIEVKKGGSGSGGGGGGDDDESIPFAGAELIVPCVLITLFMSSRRR